MTLPVLWALTVVGWLVAAAGLARGLTGRARTASLAAHGVTPFGVLLLCSMLGYGSFFAVIAMAAQWWALTLVTLFRPERLADPVGGDTVRPTARLTVWLVVATALACGLSALIV
ncbi:hypothetical protein [Thermomonospora umbrina]|uniref:Uncharacterized protein n=1 Tax=Thermomonospora umbrina TaxID=111806 RepID=A0A3D9SIJ7_9ACTN|nr:hypothetical protein [Thermomonospora umbrina]REE95736.1 hypothetical protein DFJ69_1145 [Thermomonospora umbrina]